jgi:alpha-tubulin suppressor-like RCC1 family protein
MDKRLKEQEDLRELGRRLNKLDYNSFLTIIILGNIRNKHLLALAASSKKLREFCNRPLELLNNDGNEIGHSENQYLFRLLLNRMGIRIPIGKSPKETYSERIVEGEVLAFGNNRNGQLGLGDYQQRDFVSSLKALKNNIIQIAGGDRHSLFLDNNGRVWVSGMNNDGQLGLGHFTWACFPKLIPTLENIVQVSAGNTHSLCLDNQGHVWSFGGNLFGQLGLGYIEDVRKIPIPTIIANLNNIIQISAGSNFSLCLDDTGRVWSFGSESYGQLGVVYFENDVPNLTPNLKNIIQISTGCNHSLCLDNQGRVWAFGKNILGSLGLGDYENRRTSRIITCLENITKIYAKGDRSYCLDDQGRTWGFGHNEYGELGIGKRNYINIPIVIPELQDIVEIDGGKHHTLCLDKNGRVWGFGSNEYHRLNINKTYNQNTPILIEGLYNIIHIGCGDSFSFCIQKI